MNVMEPPEFSFPGIAKVISARLLVVPHNQRSYAWEEQNVKDLYADLASALSSESPVYYLGSIVIRENNNGELEVVDGQQRLATVMILLGAIRDYLICEGQDGTAQKLESEYLVEEEVWSTVRRPRLRLGGTDSAFFQERILGRPGTEGRKQIATRQSHQRILAAQLLATEHVSQIVGPTADSRPLEVWVKYLTDRAKVALFQVPQGMNPYTIFETLNKKDLALAPSDNVKNYLFGLASSSLEQVQSNWYSMVGVLDAFDITRGEEMLVTFMRQLLSSRIGLTRERGPHGIYNRVRDNFKSEVGAVEFSEILSCTARIYAAIINASGELWSAYHSDAKEAVRTLNQLGATQIRPLVMAILSSFSADQVPAALRALVSAAVRFLVTGRSGGGVMETYYSEAAINVNAKVITSSRGLVRALQRIVPSDTEFNTAFAAATVSNSRLARYYLSSMEHYVTGANEPALLVNPDTEVVNLEHVLPKAQSESWEYFTPDEVKGYVHRIGNLVLLKSRINSRQGNDGFQSKRHCYEEAPFKLTRDIGAEQTWTVRQIEDRQKMLADVALKVWPFKESAF